MIVKDVQTAGAMPTLGAMMRFAAGRHQIITHNIANFTTPDFRPMDVSVGGFQAQLGAAVARRRRTGRAFGELQIERTREVQTRSDGSLRLQARSPRGNILFHDRNNRDVERTMQDLAENAAQFRVASTLLRTQVGLMRRAIAERAG